MNEENLKFLKDGLVYMGFGMKLQGELEAKIKEQPKDFQLAIQGEYRRPTGEAEKVDYKLDFRKNESTDMYFFNRYKATLLNDLDPTKEKSQTFYVDKGRGVTAKEAFNLLDGRSVNRDLIAKNNEPYNAWLRLEFSTTDKHGNYEVKKYSPGYGYDLLATLKKYPIKELDSNDSLVKLVSSLEKGNVQAVTFVREGKEEKMHIEANPQYKTLNVYDSDMKKIFQGNEKKEGKEPEMSAGKKEEKKENKDLDEHPDTEKAKGSYKKRGVGI